MTGAANKTVGDLVEVPPVKTVVRLGDGAADPGGVAGSFVFTEEVSGHLDVLAEALRRETGVGAFLHGDFGSGKSHFLAALQAFLSGHPGAAGPMAEAHLGLARLAEAGRRLLPVSVSLVDFRASSPLEKIVVEALEAALAGAGEPVAITPLGVFWKGFLQLLEAGGQRAAFAAAQGAGEGAGEGGGDGLDAWFEADRRRAYAAAVGFLEERGMEVPGVLVEERHETFGRAMEAVAAAGFDGVVLLLDELSEFLQAKASKGALNEDARTLQFLGELAGEGPLWVVAAVQESVERTGDIAGPTLRKIKDRYPLRLALSTLHIRDLLGRRLVRPRPGAEEVLLELHGDFRRHFPGFAASVGFDAFRATYPVHPATLSLLEGLGDLFSQHRGIVDFVHARIGGDPDRGVEGILARPAAELLAPDSIYEHFADRLLEFSAFHFYPRVAVPHLDEVIGRVVEEGDDQALARRLVRILVLYAIHPSADPPPASALAEMAACMLSPDDPELNAQFIAEGLLDPVAAAGRFLAKRPAGDGSAAGAVYFLAKEQDHAANLRARVARAAADLAPDDSRLLLDPLRALPPSPSWPGRELLEAPVVNKVVWRRSFRRVLVGFVEAGEEAEAAFEEGASRELEGGGCDAVLALSLHRYEPGVEHAAGWRLAAPEGEGAEALREVLATRLAAGGLSASNPAESPLIGPAEDALKRLGPAAAQAVLASLYNGRLHPPELDAQVEPAARQMRRFERVVELAAAHLLERRYPGYGKVSTGAAAPSARLYQLLLDGLVEPGRLSLRDARARGLAEAVEALAVPLGLVEVRAGSYFFAPDPERNALLLHLFGRLVPGSTTPYKRLVDELRWGPFGLPLETVEFLLLSLVHGGMLTLVSRGRALPLEFLRLGGLDKVDEVAPGEVISRTDRETLLRECSFLAPAEGWPTFGLRQQRDAWRAVVGFKERHNTVLAELAERLGTLAAYSAFAAFDLAALEVRLGALRRLLEAIKSSYPAREGLEAFLAAWRGSGLSAADLEFIEHLRRFLREGAEKLVFAAHYGNHRAVEQAAPAHPEWAPLRDALAPYLESPEVRVVPDQGAAFFVAFDDFRRAYSESYEAGHRAFHAPVPAKKKRARAADRPRQRALEALRRLAAVGELDRPPGLDRLLAPPPAAPAGPEPCRRNLAEELLRSPVCACGYVLGDVRPGPAAEAAAGGAEPPPLEPFLEAYVDILRSPRVAEPLAARAYALAETDPDRAAKLGALVGFLGLGWAKDGGDGGESQSESGGGGVSGGGGGDSGGGGDGTGTGAVVAPVAQLPDLIDETVGAELQKVLSGTAVVRPRDVGDLVAQLAGRRLTPDALDAVWAGWRGKLTEDTIVALEAPVSGAAHGPESPPPTFWWRLLHPGLAGAGGSGAAPRPGELAALARRLEEDFPPADWLPRLEGLETGTLADWFGVEPCHLALARAAWPLLVGRFLNDSPGRLPEIPGPGLLDPAERAALVARLGHLADLARFRGLGHPGRLQLRLPCSALLFDTWCTPALSDRLLAATSQAEDEAADWLAALPEEEPIDLAEPTLVVVCDAVPADAWLAVLPRLEEAGLAPAETGWSRLTGGASTVPALGQIFGFQPGRDPVEEFAQRGVPYHHCDGTGGRLLLDETGPAGEGGTTVIRLAFFDRAAHRQQLRLHEVPGRLADLLGHQLPALREHCRREGRALLLVNDHGLSLGPKGLDHGAGGLYERVLFRSRW